MNEGSPTNHHLSLWRNPVPVSHKNSPNYKTGNNGVSLFPTMSKQNRGMLQHIRDYARVTIHKNINLTHTRTQIRVTERVLKWKGWELSGLRRETTDLRARSPSTPSSWRIPPRSSTAIPAGESPNLSAGKSASVGDRDWSPTGASRDPPIACACRRRKRPCYY